MTTTPEAADTAAQPSFRSLKEIIEAAGGPAAIAAASEGGISAEAVYKWPKIGIPDRHWSILMGLCATTTDELHAANVLAREAVAEKAAT